uniref:Uncharacterized protein n=1 Tax=Arundo donax TaxID=35708 RepID=A0A0A9ERT1_ARUDO
MQGEEGNDEALLPTEGNSKKSHMRVHAAVPKNEPTYSPNPDPDTAHLGNSSKLGGCSREQELTAISSEKAPGTAAKGCSFTAQGAASSLPVWIRSKNCCAQQQGKEIEKVRPIREEEPRKTRRDCGERTRKPGRRIEGQGRKKRQ